jgi:hypothetical protein
LFRRGLPYLTSTDADVWLITGSPQSLVEQVYRDTALAAAGESDRQPHGAPLRRLGLPCAVWGMKKWRSWSKRSARRCAVQRL